MALPQTALHLWLPLAAHRGGQWWDPLQGTVLVTSVPKPIIKSVCKKGVARTHLPIAHGHFFDLWHSAEEMAWKYLGYYIIGAITINYYYLRLYEFARAAITKYHKLGTTNKDTIWVAYIIDIYFLKVLRLEVQDQGASCFGFSRSLSP